MSERRPPRDPTSQIRRIGQRPRFFTDLYAFLLRARWPVVVLLAAFAFMALNTIFATLYWLSPGSIANWNGSFEHAFYFSVQTFASIGYGYMYSNSSWGNCVVVLQAFSSLFYIAWLTGIVFAKFARPHARVLFSDHALIETRDGKRTLTFRVANERGNDIVEASIRVSILKTEITTEGKRMRRFFDLDLARSSSPLFILTWQVFHVIDERSPLYGMSCDDLMADDVRLTIALTGLDGTFNQTIHARHMYWPDDVLEGHRFVDVLENHPDGTITMDFRKFHDVAPE